MTLSLVQPRDSTSIGAENCASRPSLSVTFQLQTLTQVTPAQRHTITDVRLLTVLEKLTRLRGVLQLTIPVLYRRLK